MNKKDKIIKLVKEGFSNKEISERIGVSTNMVSVYKAEYNKRIKNKGIVQEDIQLPVEKKEVSVVRKPLLKITGLEGNIMNYLLSDSTINLKSKCTDKSMSLSKENINIFIQELKELRQWTL